LIQRVGQIIDGWLSWAAITPRVLTCTEVLLVVLIVLWIAKAAVGIVRRDQP